MLLSETYKRRIGELAGLSLLKEADHIDIIVDRIGLPPSIALWAHTISDKYSIWIANTLKQEIIKYLVRDDANETVRNEVEKKFKGANTPAPIKKTAEKAKQTLEGQYRYILDWLRGRHQLAPETDIIDFKTLTLEEANERSRIWHENLARLEAGKIKDEDGEVVITFSDGYYWINLGKARCDKEARAMNHCGSGRGILYSLRKDGYPHITVDLGSDGTVFQMKGRANEKPNNKYHKYILSFIADPKINVTNFNSTYRPETDFNIFDLNDVDLEELYKIKPSLFETGNILKVRPSLAIKFSEKYPEILDTIFNKHNRLYDGNLTGKFIADLQSGSKYEKFLEKHSSFFSLVLKKYPNVIIEKLMNAVNLKEILKVIKEYKELFKDNEGTYKLLASKIRTFDDFRSVRFELVTFDMTKVLKTANIETKFSIEHIARLINEYPELLDNPNKLDINLVISIALIPEGIQKIYSAEKVMSAIKDTQGLSDIIDINSLFVTLMKRFKKTEGFRIFMKEFIETYPGKLSITNGTALLGFASVFTNIENAKNIFEQKLMNGAKETATAFTRFTDKEVNIHYEKIGDLYDYFDFDVRTVVERAFGGTLRFYRDGETPKEYYDYYKYLTDDNYDMIMNIAKTFYRYEKLIGRTVDNKNLNSLDGIMNELKSVKVAFISSVTDTFNYADTKLIKAEIIKALNNNDKIKVASHLSKGIVISFPKEEFYYYIDGYLDDIMKTLGYDYTFTAEEIIVTGLQENYELLTFPVNVNGKFDANYFNKILHQKLMGAMEYFLNALNLK